jgi:nucleoside phosphorylase
MSEEKIEKVEVVIITPIELEFQAVLSHLSVIQVIEDPGTGTIYYSGNFKGVHQLWQIVLVQSGSGIMETSISILETVRLFQPEIVILTGIAGGIKDVKLGDVVVGTKAYGYERGKQLETVFAARPKVKNYTHRLVERAKVVARSKDWIKRVIAPPNTTNLIHETTIETYFGPITSGNKVLASDQSDLVKDIKLHFNDALAVEMEAIGLEVLDRFPEIMSINIRGISDLLSAKTETDRLGYQELAAAHASAFVFELLSQLNVNRQSVKTNEPSTKDKAIGFIENRRFDKAFEILLPWLEEQEEDLYDQLLVVKGAHQGYKRNLFAGLLTEAETTRQEEHISQALLQICNRI